MMRRAISDGPSVPTGYQLQVYDILDSTNGEALRLAESAAQNAVWIWAKRQTAGRGRRGRPWISSRFDLTCSLLLALDKTPAECGKLSFVSALAVRDMLNAFDPEALVTLKWPNDVLLDGKKAAGILLETSSERREGKQVLAIGIGVNLNSHPEDTDFPATHLAKYTKFPPEPDYAMQALMRTFAAWYDVWMVEGFAIIRAAWLNHALGRNHEIRVRLDKETVTGIFNSMTLDGELEILLPSGNLHTVAAGDVCYVRPPAKD